MLVIPARHCQPFRVKFHRLGYFIVTRIVRSVEHSRLVSKSLFMVNIEFERYTIGTCFVCSKWLGEHV